MSKTADVLQAIWTDPWFLDLTVEAKCLYLWGITTDHGNQAGLFVIARKVIEMETGLDRERLDAALLELGDKLRYDASTGTLWVVGKAKRIRMKTRQIAVSVIKAWRDCPDEKIAEDFAAKYGSASWLNKDELALEAEVHARFDRTSRNPHKQGGSPNLTRTSPEVQGQGQGLKEGRGSGGNQGGKVIKFDRKPVPDARLMLAVWVLNDFNQQAGTNFDPYTGTGDPSESLKRIIGALTAWPDKLDSDYCHKLTAAALKNRWWGPGPATPNVVFGPKVIEQNMARLDQPAANGGQSRSDWERLTGRTA